MLEQLFYMNEALKEAKKAKTIDEIPVGVVIVKGNEIISRAHNLKAKKNNPIEHAEIIAIKRACKKVGDWRLNDCHIYTTMEPCIMCLGAIIESRISNVYYGCVNDRYHKSIEEIAKNFAFNMEGNVLMEECSFLLKDFFKKKRKKKIIMV